MDIFEFAMEKEKEQELLYRSLAAEVREPGFRKVLLMLARDEVKHYKVLWRMRKKPGQSMPETGILEKSKSLFSGIDPRRAARTIQAGRSVDLYKKAREFEAKSRDYYLEKAAETRDPAQKELLEKLAEEEKKHFFLLENIIQFVSRPDTWVENAEFNHLDEY